MFNLKGGFMFSKQLSKEDLNYVGALLVDRQGKLTWALHHVQPDKVLLSDCDEVQDELEQVIAVLGKIRKLKGVV
jgi:hypothetical protein